MESFFKKIGKSKKPKNSSLANHNTLRSSLEPATSTSAAMKSTVEPIPSFSTAPNADSRVIRATRVTTVHELRVSTSDSALAINDLTPGANLIEENSPSSADTAVQPHWASTESKQPLSTQQNL